MSITAKEITTGKCLSRWHINHKYTTGVAIMTSANIIEDELPIQDQFSQNPYLILQEKARQYMAGYDIFYENEFEETAHEEQIAFDSPSVVDGGKKKRKCWLKLKYLDGAKGLGLLITFGVHHSSFPYGKLSKTFWMDTAVVSKEKQEQFVQRSRESRKRAEERAKDQKKIKDQKADWCKDKYGVAAPAETFHPYLQKKRIQIIGDIRQEVHRDGDNTAEEVVLLIPLKNTKGEIRALQGIFPSKRTFNEGNKPRDKTTWGSYSGCFHPLGSLKNGDPIKISEGYSTAVSIFLATNYTTLMAVSCSNIENVVQEVKKKYPQSEITICGDDDVETVDNPGRKVAEKIAQKYGCKVIFPKFTPGEERDAAGKLYKDFNDLMCTSGPEEVKRQILEAMKIPSSEPQSGQKTELICDWLDPRPIKTTLFFVPSFNDETLLPEVLRNWIMDEADRMPCPPDFIAAAVLVSLGATIGARCAIKPKSNDPWLIVPNLWGGIVGLPSAKKSPAISVALKPFDRLIARAMEEQREAKEAYEADKIVFEAKKDAIESRIKMKAKNAKKGDLDDLDSIAKELQNHRQDAPKEPILRRYKSNDTTVEKLGELLKENPAGLLVLRDELVGLIASWDKAGREGDRAFYLEAWNGNSSFDTDRIGRGHIFIPNLCTSLFGGIQPDKLTIYLEQSANALANDGMLQRFQMLVYPDHRDWEWCDRSPDKDARNKACAVFDTIANFDPIAWGAIPCDDFSKFPHFYFEEEAQKIFIEWSTALNRVRLLAEDNPLIAQHLGKYDKVFSALALIFHIVDCAANWSTGPVKAESALRAVAWCEYLEAHARRCYGLLADDGLRSAQALADKLSKVKLSDGFTARDVRRNQWRYLTTDEAVQAALDWLEDEGWLRANEVGGTGPGTGRRTIRYFINPKVKKMNKSEDEHDQLA